MNPFRFLLAMLLAVLACAALADPPVDTTMRPNWIYKNNQRLAVPPLKGRNYDDSYPQTSFLPQGYDTPVPGGTETIRPARCNQPWTGADGTNASTYTGSASGTTLTVASVSSGTVGIGHAVFVGSSNTNRYVTAQLTGTTGGAGTYSLNASLSLGSQTLKTNANGCQRNAGNFRTFCSFTHFDYADPIVYPRGPGKSHLHAFFGNTAVNAYSSNGTDATTSIALTGNSTCSGGTKNRSAYWVPAVVYHCPVVFDPTCDYALDGMPIAPFSLNVYYKGAHGAGSWINDGAHDSTWSSLHDIQPMPTGFRMIAGDPSAAANQTGIVTWLCRSANESNDWITSGHIPGTGTGASDACPQGTTAPPYGPFVKVRAEVTFPTCWNGVDLDSPTHNTHVAYPTAGACPVGWVQIVGIGYQVDFRITNTGVHDAVGGRDISDVKRWRLDSDRYSDTMPAGYSMHGDWFNGWIAAVMLKWVTDCLRTGIDCHDDIIGIHSTNVASPPNIWEQMRTPDRDR